VKSSLPLILECYRIQVLVKDLYRFSFFSWSPILPHRICTLLARPPDACPVPSRCNTRYFTANHPVDLPGIFDAAPRPPLLVSKRPDKGLPPASVKYSSSIQKALCRKDLLCFFSDSTKTSPIGCFPGPSVPCPPRTGEAVPDVRLFSPPAHRNVP